MSETEQKLDENKNETKKNEEEIDISSYEWMIRPCDMYDDEYNDCTSIKARFHQYFVFGETVDCSQWKRDLNSCKKWADNKDVKAAKELIKSETIRRQARMKANSDNNVWEKRTSPPADWNKPLPKYLLDEYEYTYLNIKNKEMKGEIPPVIDTDKCSIM